MDGWASSVSLILRLHPSLSCAKWYNFHSVSSPQSSKSTAHSLCGLPLLLFPSIHYFEHHCLKFPVVTHSGHMSKQVHFTPYYFLQDRLFSVHSTEYCVVFCYFLPPFPCHDSSVTHAFER